MGKLILPERKIWSNFKPDFPVELNPDHPLFKYLVFAEWNGVDLLANRVASSFSGNITSGGRGTYNSAYPYPAQLTSTSISFVAGIYLHSYTAANLLLFPFFSQTTPIGDTYVQTYFGLNQLGGGSYANPFLRVQNNVTGGQEFGIQSSANVPLGIHHYAGTIDQATATCQWFEDGVLESNMTGGGSWATLGAASSSNGYSSNQTISVSASAFGDPLSGVLYSFAFNGFVLDSGWAESFTQNPSQLLRPRQRALMISVGSGGGVALDSTTTATGTGTGTLSVEIPIQSSSVAVASGTGILSQSVSFAGSGTATVTGTGDLQISIPFNASAIATAAGSASMSIAQALAGSGTATGSGSGTLSTNGQMSGSGTATGSGAGTISLSIALSASAIAQAVGSGQLSISGAMAGSGTASGSGTGNLTQSIPLVSSSLATVSGTGTMVNSVPLTSSAVVNASGAGMIGVQVGFSAHAFADAIGTGNMTLVIRLSGQAVAQAVGSGALSQSGVLQSNRRFTINALGRNFIINAF